MENASKALLIAGAVLICIVLISVGMVIVNSSSEVTDQVSDVTTSQAVETFNTGFSSYAGKQKGSSVKKLLEKIATNNKVTANTTSHAIRVTFTNNNAAVSNSSDANTITKAMSKVVNSGTYTVELTEMDTNGYISHITITRNS